MDDGEEGARRRLTPRRPVVLDEHPRAHARVGGERDARGAQPAGGDVRGPLGARGVAEDAREELQQQLPILRRLHVVRVHTAAVERGGRDAVHRAAFLWGAICIKTKRGICQTWRQTLTGASGHFGGHDEPNPSH